MPADGLFACFVTLTWVRLEARPFHIPSRIALVRWFCGFVFAYDGQFGGDDRPLYLPVLRSVHLQRGQAWKPAPTGLFLRFGWLWCLSDDVVVFTMGLFASLDTLSAIGLASSQLESLPKDIISHS